MTYPTPEAEGWFWAKLRLAEEPDTNSSTFEPCFAFDNILRPWCEADIETGECMMVSVPGVERSYPLDAFVWGPQIIKPDGLS